MLTVGDRIRLKAKDVEFMLPPFAIRVLAPIAGVRNPYLPQDDQLQSIFIHIPKSAGTSIRNALYQSKSFHIPVARYRAFDEERFNKYFKFCVVRNPWSRVASAFYYLYKRKTSSELNFLDHRWVASMLRNVRSFEDFVLKLEDRKFQKRVCEYIHFRSQLDWICVRDIFKKRVCVDYIAKYENLDAEMRHLSTILYREIKTEKLRAGCGRDYRTEYTNRMVDIIGQIYHEDSRVLGYSFE